MINHLLFVKYYILTFHTQSRKLPILDTPGPKDVEILGEAGIPMNLPWCGASQALCPTAASPRLRTTCAAAPSLSVV